MDDGRDRTERQELHFFPPSLQNYLSITVFATPSLFLVCLDLSCNKKITLKPVVRIVSNYLFNWQSGHRSLAILFSNHIFFIDPYHYKMLHQMSKMPWQRGRRDWWSILCSLNVVTMLCCAIGGGGGVQRLMSNALHFFSPFSIPFLWCC